MEKSNFNVDEIPVDLGMDEEDGFKFSAAEKQSFDNLEAQRNIRETAETVREVKSFLMQQKKKPGRPKKGDLDEIRYTTILPKRELAIMREIAYRERLLIKDVMTAAVVKYIAEYQEKHGIVFITKQ